MYGIREMGTETASSILSSSEQVDDPFSVINNFNKFYIYLIVDLTNIMLLNCLK